MFRHVLFALLIAWVPAFGEEWGPYDGPSNPGVDPSTLTGKVMTGYQGWFTCEGDRDDLGWIHWAKNPFRPFEPGNVSVDLWPDVSELSEFERYPTGFHHADGRVAEVFSSANRETVLRHFEWMRDYGIDGAFVQRFANGLDNPGLLNQKNKVLRHCREGANRAGRTYAVMYDLSGLKKGEVARVSQDWQILREQARITEDPAYLHHEGKPVISIWGIGFDDDRPYTLAECAELVDFLKADGCAVMLGIPTWWRDQTHDAVADPKLHELLAKADILSPWTVGRYRTPEEATRHAAKFWTPDVAWCGEREIDFLPVVYPGFSWFNLHGDELDAIPRLGGKFLWSQVIGAKRAGAGMIYVAMFDEVDEGTAIFKCTNDVPVGDGVQFLGLHGLPSDFYLRLTGFGARMLRGEIPATDELPEGLEP
ncbi:MAG: xylosidase/arabinosidase [Verrucomicrobiae bacterium]|nr:xylosidase/arabinosidase [Verrucomicrobiae bacterium]